MNDIEIMLVQKNEFDYKIPNGGFHTPAESCSKLCIAKDGKYMILSGRDLALIYNAIRPVGTAPEMTVPEN